MTKDHRNTINLMKKVVNRHLKEINRCKKEIEKVSDESYIKSKRRDIIKYHYLIKEVSCIMDTLQNQWQREEDVRRWGK